LKNAHTDLPSYEVITRTLVLSFKPFQLIVQWIPVSPGMAIMQTARRNTFRVRSAAMVAAFAKFLRPVPEALAWS